MLLAHKRKDDAAFRQAVEGYIADERKRNHPTLARELERILLNGSLTPTGDQVSSLSVLRNDFPRDKERNATLVELHEPERDQNSLVLTAEVCSALEHLVDENRRADVLRTHGMRPASRILFCGPPGCGKTVAAETIAKALYRPLALVRFDAVVSSYLGETAANLRKVFDFARSRSMVVLFDEFDAIGKYRTDESEHGELKRVVNSFLQMMDGFRSESLLIAATNHQGLLDSALWRRFDEIVFFDIPSSDMINSLMLQNLRQMGLAPSVSIEQVAASLVGMSHADVERICLDAIKEAILEGKAYVDNEVLGSAVARQRRRVLTMASATEGAHPSMVKRGASPRRKSKNASSF
jgi:SpoVK/Ycf46/Vps4 family AAA+-type ATPase